MTDRPDVEGIEARAHWPATKDRIRAGWKHVESGPVLSLRVWASQQPPQGDFAVSLDLIADHIKALEARQVKLEAVVEAGQLVAEGSGVEVGTTPLRMRLLRERLAALGDGDG